MEAIINTSNQVSLLLVQFENERVGVKAISLSHYREQHSNAVPINRHEAVFNILKLSGCLLKCFRPTKYLVAQYNEQFGLLEKNVFL